MRVLEANGYRGRRAPVVHPELRDRQPARARRADRRPLVQLINCTGAPYDLVAAGDPRTYADLATPRGLAEIADVRRRRRRVQGRDDPPRRRRQPGGTDGRHRDAHAERLVVHGWTFRRENQFLPDRVPLQRRPRRRSATWPARCSVFLDAGMDGFFTDNPDIGAATVSG